MKKLIVIPLFALFLASCASTPGDSGADFASAWDEADAKRKQAAGVGYEWRDTGKMLKQAKEEHEAGNTDAAMELVNQAMEESADALAQYERETTAWASRVPQ